MAVSQDVNALVRRQTHKPTRSRVEKHQHSIHTVAMTKFERLKLGETLLPRHDRGLFSVVLCLLIHSCSGTSRLATGPGDSNKRRDTPRATLGRWTFFGKACRVDIATEALG
jgi:hypothetical protein